MKLPAEEAQGRRRIIAEQWWVGIALLVFWGVMVLVMCRSCQGGDIPQPAAFIRLHHAHS